MLTGSVELFVLFIVTRLVSMMTGKSWPNRRLSAQSAVSIDIFLRDGHFVADAERAAGDF